MSTTALETLNHYIGGQESAGASTRTAPVYDPATGTVARHVLLAEPGDVDAAVQAAKQAFDDVEQHLGRAPRAGDVRLPRADRRAHRRARAGHLLRARQDLRGRQGRGHPRDGGRRVRVRDRAADQGRVLRPGLHRRRPVLLPPAAGRVRGDHAVQLPDHGAAVDAPDRDRDRQHVRPEAVRARSRASRTSSRTSTSRPGSRRACSTSSTATRWRSTRCSTTRTSPRSASSARRRSPSTSTSARPRRASACRRSAARRTTRS